MSWRMSRKLFEIPNKMRLVMEAELVRDQGPIDGLDGVNAVQDLSKAVETRQFFRRTANHLPELSDQMLLAHAHTIA